MVHSSAPWRKGEPLWRNHDLCQRRDVRLSKEWRYEPIMINAPHSCDMYTPLWPEVKLHGSCLAVRRSLFISVSFIVQLDTVPLLLCCCGCLFHVICLRVDRQRCSWWIPTIQHVREQGSKAVTFKLRLSNLSLSDAPHSGNQTLNKRRRSGWAGERLNLLDCDQNKERIVGKHKSL